MHSPLKQQRQHHLVFFFKSLTLTLALSALQLNALSAQALTQTPTSSAEDADLLVGVAPLEFSSGEGARRAHVKAGLLLQGFPLKGERSGEDRAWQTSAHLFRARPGLEVTWGAQGSQRYSRVYVQSEWVGEPKLLDAELEVSFSRALKVMFGRNRTLFMRSWRTGLGALSTPGRGEVSDAFHPKRATGLTLFGEQGDFEYALSAFDEGAMDGSGNRLPHYAARLTWNPLGATPYTQTPWANNLRSLRLAVGLNAMLDTTKEHPMSEMAGHTEGLDLTVLNGQFAWLTEAYTREERDPIKALQTQLGLLLKRLSAHEMIDSSARFAVLKAPKTSKRVSVEGTLGYLANTHRAKLSLHAQWTQGGTPNGYLSADQKEPSDLRVSLFGQLFLW